MLMQALKRATEMVLEAPLVPDRSRASGGTVLEWRLPPAVELQVEPVLSKVPELQVRAEQKMEQLVLAEARYLQTLSEQDLLEQPALAKVPDLSIGSEQKMAEQLVLARVLNLPIGRAQEPAQVLNR